MERRASSPNAPCSTPRLCPPDTLPLDPNFPLRRAPRSPQRVTSRPPQPGAQPRLAPLAEPSQASAALRPRRRSALTRTCAAPPRPTSQRPPSSPPPNLATTSVGDGSSVDDRRSEPIGERASVPLGPSAERRTERSEPDGRASIFLSGRAPSGKHSPARAWGDKERATDSVASAATTSRVEPVPSSQQPLTAPPPSLANDLSARPRPASQRPPVGGGSSVDDRRSEPLASEHLLSGRAPSGKHSPARAWGRHRRPCYGFSSACCDGLPVDRVQPRHHLGRRMFLMRRPAQSLIGEREHLELLGRAPSECTPSSALTRRRSPPNACSGCQSAALRVRGGDKGTRYGFRSVCCPRPPGSSPFQARNNLSPRHRPASQRPRSAHVPHATTGAASLVGERASGTLGPSAERIIERASIFLSGRAPSGSHRPQKAKGAQAWKSARLSAGWTGLEPAASGVTGRRYNRLNYHPK